MSGRDEHTGRDPRDENASDADPSDEARDDSERHGNVDPASGGADYDLGDPLGEGGMAIVYQATEQSLGRTVAVKCLRDELARRTDGQLFAVRRKLYARVIVGVALITTGTFPVVFLHYK